MVDDSPIEIHIAPNLEESTRVMMRYFLTSPIGIFYDAIILLNSVWSIYHAVDALRWPILNETYIAVCISWALAVPGALFFWLRFDMRRQLNASHEIRSSTIFVYSKDAIEVRLPHGSAPLDWNAVKWARRIPEGVVVCLGGPQFYSRTYFANGDFDRFMKLLRFKLEARAKV